MARSDQIPGVVAPPPILYVPVYNAGAEAVPPFGLARVVDVVEGIFHVEVSDADGRNDLIVNGPVVINPETLGQMSYTYPAVAGYDHHGDVPQPGETWGCEAGEYYLKYGVAGFRILSTGVGGLVVVERAAQPAGPDGDVYIDGDLTVEGNTTFAAVSIVTHEGDTYYAGDNYYQAGSTINIDAAATVNFESSVTLIFADLAVNYVLFLTTDGATTGSPNYTYDPPSSTLELLNPGANNNPGVLRLGQKPAGPANMAANAIAAEIMLAGWINAAMRAFAGWRATYTGDGTTQTGKMQAYAYEAGVENLALTVRPDGFMQIEKGTAQTVPYLDADKSLKSVTLGAGLSLVAGTLTATAASVTATRVAYGDGSNAITGTADFTRTADGGVNVIAQGATAIGAVQIATHNNNVDLADGDSAAYLNLSGRHTGSIQGGVRFQHYVRTSSSDTNTILEVGVGVTDTATNALRIRSSGKVSIVTADTASRLLVTDANGNVATDTAAGQGLLLAASNLSDVTNAATAFGNIKQAASETATGVVELATTAEAQTGTDTSRAVTPAGLRAATREKLTAARTYYIATTGNDTTGDGSSGTPWLTINKAIDVINATIDTGGQAVTISVAAGTYTTPVVLKPIIGGGTVSIVGAGLASTIISTTSADAISASQAGAGWAVTDLKTQTTTSGNCLTVQNDSIVTVRDVAFGACAGFHATARADGVIRIDGSYTINGSASQHLRAVAKGLIEYTTAGTVTLTGTPAFGTFAASERFATLLATATPTHSGAALAGTVRYTVTGNSVIFTNAGGASFFPGNVAGSTATGGQYL